MTTTAHLMVRSAGAATVSQLWRLAVTFLTHLLLRRLITPEEMGIWAWAEPLFLILAQVRDVGLPGHVVRARTRPYGNFLRVELLWGGFLAAAVFVAAPHLRLFYAGAGDDFVPILRTLCLFFFIQGLGAVPLTFLEAELRVDRAVPAELARNAVFAILSLGLAASGFGVWSVIAGHLAGATLYAAMLWRAAWPELRRHLTRMRGATAGLLRLSWPLALLSLLELAVLKLDTFVLGPYFRAEIVGFVGLATYAVFFFPRLLADPVGRALYPALVRYRDDPPRAFEAFRIATLLLLAFAAPTACFLFVNAEWAVRFLGGERWLGAAAYLRVLSLVPLIRPLSMFGFELLLTRHRDRLLLLYTTTNLVALSGLGLFLIRTDLRELGMAVAGYFPLGLLFLAWGIYRLDPVAFRRLARDVVELYAVAALLFGPIAAFTARAGYPRLLLSCLAGALVLAWAWRRWGASYARFMRAETAP
ncbi:MAG: hypothetical protein D6696_01680 [Acidobacteria bacterium]|nr:MAG: hypothetical protein D6696_01680 [Acidobacteriota bacterium]